MDRAFSRRYEIAQAQTRGQPAFQKSKSKAWKSALKWLAAILSITIGNAIMILGPIALIGFVILLLAHKL